MMYKAQTYCCKNQMASLEPRWLEPTKRHKQDFSHRFVFLKTSGIVYLVTKHNTLEVLRVTASPKKV